MKTYKNNKSLTATAEELVQEIESSFQGMWRGRKLSLRFLYKHRIKPCIEKELVKAINQHTLNHIWDSALVVDSSFILPQQQNQSDSPARQKYIRLQWLVIIARLSHSYLDGVSNEPSVPSCKSQNPRITECWGWSGTPRAI